MNTYYLCRHIALIDLGMNSFWCVHMSWTLSFGMFSGLSLRVTNSLGGYHTDSLYSPFINSSDTPFSSLGVWFDANGQVNMSIVWQNDSSSIQLGLVHVFNSYSRYATFELPEEQNNYTVIIHNNLIQKGIFYSTDLGWIKIETLSKLSSNLQVTLN